MADIDLTEAVEAFDMGAVIETAADAIAGHEITEYLAEPVVITEGEAHDLATEAIAAALPAIREQLARQIEADAPSAELVREGSFGSLGSRRAGMLRAAFIVRGES